MNEKPDPLHVDTHDDAIVEVFYGDGVCSPVCEAPDGFW